MVLLIGFGLDFVWITICDFFAFDFDWLVVLATYIYSFLGFGLSGWFDFGFFDICRIWNRNWMGFVCPFLFCCVLILPCLCWFYFDVFAFQVSMILLVR